MPEQSPRCPASSATRSRNASKKRSACSTRECKTIRQAYQRTGLPYTRSHLLRHTIARRLLDGGSSLKEVADVLRHRSLNTTLTYAKLDSRGLGAVALPWPRSLPAEAPPMPPEVALPWPERAP